MIRRYSELIRFPTFLERFNYLRLNGNVGSSTFGEARYMNQIFYHSGRWKKVRDQIIIRDNALDLGVEGRDIRNKVLIHHLNPITMRDLEEEHPSLYDPENLICVTPETHQAIHYGDEHLLIPDLVERKPGDTCLWRD